MKKLSKAQQIDFYTKMLRIRRVEENLLEVFAKGEIPGFIHACIGQEAAPVAVCSHLNDADSIGSTHRGHGHALAKGVDLKLFMAELFGKKNGLCRGRSGSMHVADRNLGIIGANGIVGGGIPLALGTAFTSLYRQGEEVTVAFFGEGSTNEGTFHESMNMAAVKKLPLVFVCENNRWSQFTPDTVYMPIQEVAGRAEGYNIPGVSVSNDFFRIYEEAGKAVERARKGEGPTLIEVMCHRWYGHFVGDQQKYRSKEDIEKAMADDCIAKFQESLVGDKILSEEKIEEIESEIKKEIEEALDFARQSPLPEASELMDDLYI